MNHMLSIVFIALLTVAGAAQEITKNDRTPTRLFGSVSGEIVIKEKSGNGLGNFACSNLVVSLNKLGGGWEQKVRANGDFSKLRCRFVVPAVSAGQSFVAVTGADGAFRISYVPPGTYDIVVESAGGASATRSGVVVTTGGIASAGVVNIDNLGADTKNCGVCGNVCQPGQVCSSGQCAFNCLGNLTACNGRASVNVRRST